MNLVMSLFSAIHNRFTTLPENLIKDSYRYFATFNYIMLMGAGGHFMLLVIFGAFGITPLAYLNIVSVTFWLIALWLNLRGLFVIAIFLMLSELIAHAAVCVLIIGWESNFHYYLFIIIVASYFLPIKSIFRTMLISILFIFVGILLNFYSRYSIPIIPISENLAFLFRTINLLFIGAILLVLGFLYALSVKNAETALEQERQISENLLHNIIPQTIADRLKTSPEKIADGFQATTILFSDIVGFTPFSKKVSPEELVNILNQIFSIFDTLTDKYSLEKIKTIGDAYMVAGGIPSPRDDHAEAIANMALDMNDEIKKFNGQNGHTFQIRTGIHSGEAVAGVIGIKKFIYDLWGDTVNTASRMESHGLPGEIQVSEVTYDLLKDSFVLEERGEIDVKGKGLMKTYLLKDRL